MGDGAFEFWKVAGNTQGKPSLILYIILSLPNLYSLSCTHSLTHALTLILSLYIYTLSHSLPILYSPTHSLSHTFSYWTTTVDFDSCQSSPNLFTAAQSSFPRTCAQFLTGSMIPALEKGFRMISVYCSVMH